MFSDRLRCIRLNVLVVVLFLVGTLCASAGPPCNPASGCVKRKNGGNAQWWADSWRKGRCTEGSGDIDWIVTYNTDNSTWRDADISKMHFGAAWWSGARYYPWSGKAQVIDNDPPGIRICLGSNLQWWDVKGTYVWIEP